MPAPLDYAGPDSEPRTSSFAWASIGCGAVVAIGVLLCWKEVRYGAWGTSRDSSTLASTCFLLAPFFGLAGVVCGAIGLFMRGRWLALIGLAFSGGSLIAYGKLPIPPWLWI